MLEFACSLIGFVLGWVLCDRLEERRRSSYDAFMKRREERKNEFKKP